MDKPKALKYQVTPTKLKLALAIIAEELEKFGGEACTSEL